MRNAVPGEAAPTVESCDNRQQDVREWLQNALRLFSEIDLQLLIVTPMQKIHIIEPFVASVGFVHNEDGRTSRLRNLSIEEYREERARAAG